MSDARPNILLILTDQQRGDCLGLDPLAPAALQTPNSDALARRGTHFHHGYAECPSCIPARRTIMSGMAPAANGCVGFRDGIGWDPAHTLAGELGMNGYQTEMIGKLHLHPRLRRYGFDHMQQADATRGEPNEYTDWLVRQHGKAAVHPGMAHGASANGWVGRPHHLPEEQMHTFWVVDRAMEFMRKRDPSAPYFLNISFIDPHPPLTPPALYYERYIHRDLPPPVVGDWATGFTGPERGLDPNASRLCLPAQDMQCARAAYYGMINFIDDQIGRLLQYADMSNTFILFASDHGEMLGDHHLFRKTFPYEASARVPFFACAPPTWFWPSEIAATSAVGLQDIMPTLLDVAGCGIPDSCTGRSLLPIMRGETSAVRDVLHGEHSGCYDHADGNHFLTDGHEKYIWYTQTGKEQLFDLDADPDEGRDLALSDTAEVRVKPWRERLIDALRGRPEGFTDGDRLIGGRPHDTVLPGYDPGETYPVL